MIIIMITRIRQDGNYHDDDHYDDDDHHDDDDNQAGVMRRLRGSRDPWEQLGVARGANREEVDIIINIINIIIIIMIVMMIIIIISKGSPGAKTP